MNITAHRFVFFALAATAMGCVTSPLDDETLFDHTAPVTFQGYAGIPSDTVSLMMNDSGTWVEVSTTTASASISNAGDVRNLYFYSFPEYTIPEDAWTQDCGSDWVSFRVEERGYPLGTFDAAAWDCVVDELTAGSGIYTSGQRCYSGRDIVLTRPSTPC